MADEIINSLIERQIAESKRMAYEYRVEEEGFGKPKDTEDHLNELAEDGWEHYAISTLGPIPTRWLYFRRPIPEKK